MLTQSMLHEVEEDVKLLVLSLAERFEEKPPFYIMKLIKIKKP